ncbi:hypothetical protein [Salipiger bermudensis]|uniref:hypothetical protein n=1 Tax=Salipiger bermudensis TaxID=344736 RepID=UPI001CD5D8A9|nr:hypothetical protein [Salipiger bermudensis]MCA0962228.1 hypothetical protein [Salipiger bermudensis]
MTFLRAFITLSLLLAPVPGVAAAFLSLHGSGKPLLQQGQPLFGPSTDENRGADARNRPSSGITPPASAHERQASLGTGSLFAGRWEGGLFAPVAPRAGAPLLGPVSGVAAHLRNVIAWAEAGPAGYDAVQHGARIRPPRAPTRMTLVDIFQWIADTPGQPHAIGRYQFIPDTLRRLVRRADLPRHTRFSPEVQDRLADLLLRDAGLHDLQAGAISRTRFMNNLAQIWAGLPTSSGRSHYHGYAGNKATMTWARFHREVSRVLPD